MRRHFSCIDNETGMELILSECSYNMACSWLESQGFTEYDHFDSWYDEYNSNIVEFQFSKPARRTFVYDEGRGYLLGD